MTGHMAQGLSKIHMLILINQLLLGEMQRAFFTFIFF